MSNTVLKVVKVGVAVLGVATTIVTSIIESKELDNKVAEKVAEALANQNK